VRRKCKRSFPSPRSKRVEAPGPFAAQGHTKPAAGKWGYPSGFGGLKKRMKVTEFRRQARADAGVGLALELKVSAYSRVSNV
jgi:hypothetical protein